MSDIYYVETPAEIEDRYFIILADSVEEAWDKLQRKYGITETYIEDRLSSMIEKFGSDGVLELTDLIGGQNGYANIRLD